MESTTLRHNLLRLNDLLTLEDRRRLIRHLGIGAGEIVSYLTGQRVPQKHRQQQILRFFSIPEQVDLRRAKLDDATVQTARTALARHRKERRNEARALSAAAVA